MKEKKTHTHTHKKKQLSGRPTAITKKKLHIYILDVALTNLIQNSKDILKTVKAFKVLDSASCIISIIHFYPFKLDSQFSFY